MAFTQFRLCVFFLLPFLVGCTNKNTILNSGNLMKLELPKSLPHAKITKVTENIFIIEGANVVEHEGIILRSSRTMTIIRDNGELTLVNTIRLDENGLDDLEKLGKIKNVIRLGAFHGRDDAFYQQNFGAKLWAFKEMEFSHGEVVDHELDKEALPIKNSRLFEFKSTRFKEALLVLEQSGGILISCDSIKNWQHKDEFFDDKTFEIFKNNGSIGPARIDKTWLTAMIPSRVELRAIGDIRFKILLSAHGAPLLKNAKDLVLSSIEKALTILNKE